MNNWVSAFSFLYYACKITVVFYFVQWAISA